VQFYVGMFHPAECWPFRRVMVSINRIRDRKSGFKVNDWIMDSGAFTTLDKAPHRYRKEPEQYAEEINRWSSNGNLVAAVSQDYMCEPFILEKTGMTVEAHQELTINRYLKIRDNASSYVMPVIQGWRPEQYVRHIKMYGTELKFGTWAGVGSICKRTRVEAIEDVLLAVHSARPDLRLHAFGVKKNALASPTVRRILEDGTADSMAWSDAARSDGRGSDANDPREALKFMAEIESLTGCPSFIQQQLFHEWSA
jgi:hypothetical protein